MGLSVLEKANYQFVFAQNCCQKNILTHQLRKCVEHGEKGRGKALSGICNALLGVTLRSQPHCLLKSVGFYSLLYVCQSLQTAQLWQFSATLISSAVDPCAANSFFLYENVHGMELS